MGQKKSQKPQREMDENTRLSDIKLPPINRVPKPASTSKVHPSKLSPPKNGQSLNLEYSNVSGLDKNLTIKSKDVDVFKRFEDKEEITKKKSAIFRMIDSSAFQIYILIITIIALFADDIRVIFIPSNRDWIVDALIMLALVSFAFELIMLFISDPGYRWGFFFSLDFVSTVSLLLEINMFAENIFKNIE